MCYETLQSILLFSNILCWISVELCVVWLSDALKECMKITNTKLRRTKWDQELSGLVSLRRRIWPTCFPGIGLSIVTLLQFCYNSLSFCSPEVLVLVAHTHTHLEVDLFLTTAGKTRETVSQILHEALLPFIHLAWCFLCNFKAKSVPGFDLRRSIWHIFHCVTALIQSCPLLFLFKCFLQARSRYSL